jgi:putative transposase
MQRENAQLRRAVADQTGESRFCRTLRRETLSPERRRIAVQHGREKGLSERRACLLVGQRSVISPRKRHDEDRLLWLPATYGDAAAGGLAGRQDRVERIWKREGLKVPARQKPRRRLWPNDGSGIRLRPERRNHVCSYDFVEARTHEWTQPAAADPDR